MDKTLSDQLGSLVGAIDDAIQAHQAGRESLYSVSFLERVRKELETMRDEWPSFPFRFGRAIVDWPETALGGQILRFGDRFERARRRALNVR